MRPAMTGFSIFKADGKKVTFRAPKEKEKAEIEMTKKRSQRKRKKRGRPATGSSLSTTAMAVMERISAPESGFFAQDNVIRLLRDSAILRQEPEFADFYLEPRQTLEVAARHFPRLSRRVERVTHWDEDTAGPIYDDFRIAVLDDLGTPQFRQELRRRLIRCMDRLQRGHNAERIEMALFLGGMLNYEKRTITDSKKTLPLGVYGLLTTIYEDSFDRAMTEIPEARNLVGDTLYEMWCARHTEEDLAAITAVVEQIDDFDELAVRLDRDPALALAWQRQEAYLIEQLQMHMAKRGLNVEPGFFTPEEAALPLIMMEQRYWNRPWSPSRYFIGLAMMNFARCIRETLDEIVSPQRMAQMSQGLKSVGQACLETDDEHLRSLVPHVQAAIHHLKSETRPSQNQVVTALYMMNLPLVMNDDTLGPRWQRFFERTQNSRLMQKLAQSGGMGAGL